MATSNHIKLLLKIARHWSRKSQAKGFTLPELLMAMVVAGIVVYAMLSLVMNLLGTDKKETAKSQTQVEMSQAMDYIARELQQAVYIYPGDCLGTRDRSTDDGDPYTCPGLRNEIDFDGAGVIPVLAFWKLEDVADYMADDDSLPTCNQGDANAQECFSLLTSLHTYTLVVYSFQEVADGDIWDGPNIIRRFILRKYTDVSDLQQTAGYSAPPATPNPPASPGTIAWESTALIPVDNNTNNPVLVDLVDEDGGVAKQDCPTTDYTQSEDSLSSFYACVSNPSAGGQDAIVYLRGNAAERAGQPNSRSPVYLPSIKRQVKARSVLDYTPPNL